VASQRAQALLLQRAAERVDLRHDVAERLVAARAARANGEIPLAQRGEQVRHGLERTDDAFLHREREAQPEEGR